MCISQKESPKPAKTHKNAGKKQTTTTPQKHPPKANINETQQSTKKQPTTTPTNRHDNQPKNQSSITMTSKNQPPQPKKQTTHYRVLKQPATTRNTPKPEHTSRNDPHNTTHTHTNTQTPSPHPKNHPPTTQLHDLKSNRLLPIPSACRQRQALRFPMVTTRWFLHPQSSSSLYVVLAMHHVRSLFLRVPSLGRIRVGCSRRRPLLSPSF